jgi:hypothetical protein
MWKRAVTLPVGRSEPATASAIGNGRRLGVNLSEFNGGASNRERPPAASS